jgi:putative nucleotidyltransferase with HDIG domain
MDLKAVEKQILKDPILSRLSQLAEERKVPLFLVGGTIRDLLLRREQGLPPAHEKRDYDFTLPKEDPSFISMMEEALHLRFFRIGKEEMNTLTYRVVKDDLSIDLTLFQGKRIQEDLQRRDFTINAIAFSLLDRTFHWVEGGLEDIERRVLRTVSPLSIPQDPLRMLRAIRYLCTLEGVSLDSKLKEEISLKKDLAEKLPGERIKMELDQILLSPRPAAGIRSLYELGLLLILLPELKGLETLSQNEYHHLDVLSHVLLMTEKISWAYGWTTRTGKGPSLSPEDWLSLFYAALFHDIGKQDTFSEDEEGRIHFYHHESFSCQRAERMMERLRFSNTMKNRVLHLVQNHMRVLNLSGESKESALKRLVNHMADDTPLLVLHTLADMEASRGILSIQKDDVVESHCLRILTLFQEKDIVHPPPLITGHDVMALGYSSGPKVGQILNFIRQKQVEGEIRNREEALELLREKFGD